MGRSAVLRTNHLQRSKGNQNRRGQRRDGGISYEPTDQPKPKPAPAPARPAMNTERWVNEIRLIYNLRTDFATGKQFYVVLAFGEQGFSGEGETVEEAVKDLFAAMLADSD